MIRARLAALAALAFAAASGSACKTYEYEEEVFLEIDGSGRFRVSGSRPALSALHGLDATSIGAVSRYFEDEGIEITSVRETERRSRAFFHVEATFADWNAVCHHRAFEKRSCRLVLDEEAGERRLELSVPLPRLAGEAGGESVVEGYEDELVAVRFHFPSSVLEHNAPNGIGRGNILSWERPLTEPGASNANATPIDIRVRFDDESILSTTVRILALAAATVVTAVVVGLTWMYRKGKRQLAET